MVFAWFGRSFGHVGDDQFRWEELSIRWLLGLRKGKSLWASAVLEKELAKYEAEKSKLLSTAEGKFVSDSGRRDH